MLMQRHMDSDIQVLKQKILSMAGSVEKQIELVCDVLASKDPRRLDEVRQQERRINDLQIEVDQACVEMLARQAPLAKDLRLVVAVIKINTDLERMGDQVVNIAHCARDIFEMGRATNLSGKILTMGHQVREMVRSSIDAFVKQDVAQSRAVLVKDDVVDQLRDEIVAEAIEKMKLDPSVIASRLEEIMIARNFERLADHATNLAEEVIYLATGDDVRHGHSTGPGGG